MKFINFVEITDFYVFNNGVVSPDFVPRFCNPIEKDAVLIDYISNTLTLKVQ